MTSRGTRVLPRSARDVGGHARATRVRRGLPAQAPPRAASVRCEAGSFGGYSGARAPRPPPPPAARAARPRFRQSSAFPSNNGRAPGSALGRMPASRADARRRLQLWREVGELLVASRRLSRCVSRWREVIVSLMMLCSPKPSAANSSRKTPTTSRRRRCSRGYARPTVPRPGSRARRLEARRGRGRARGPQPRGRRRDRAARRPARA